MDSVATPVTTVTCKSVEGFDLTHGYTNVFGSDFKHSQDNTDLFNVDGTQIVFNTNEAHGIHTTYTLHSSEAKDGEFVNVLLSGTEEPWAYFSFTDQVAHYTFNEAANEHVGIQLYMGDQLEKLHIDSAVITVKAFQGANPRAWQKWKCPRVGESTNLWPSVRGIATDVTTTGLTDDAAKYIVIDAAGDFTNPNPPPTGSTDWYLRYRLRLNGVVPEKATVTSVITSSDVPDWSHTVTTIFGGVPNEESYLIQPTVVAAPVGAVQYNVAVSAVPGLELNQGDVSLGFDNLGGYGDFVPARDMRQ